jgi:hypothetical protein
MPYTHFRYIAYQVPTATCVRGQNGVESGFDPGDTCPEVNKWLLNVEEMAEQGVRPAFVSLCVKVLNPPKDEEIRLRRLAAVIYKAAEELRRLKDNDKDNENTLKIFIVPEFYFRPPAKTDKNYIQDTYPVREFLKIWKAFDCMFQDDNFKDWLFVLGTVMWNDVDFAPYGMAGTKSELKPSQSAHFFNSAMYVRGGKRKNPTQRIEKQMASSIDGIHLFLTPGEHKDLKPIYEDWRTRSERVFRVENIDLGLEVCLDHGNAVLKTVLSEWSKKGNPKACFKKGADRDISLHLLTAGGMRINNESVAAKKDGYILRNDGYLVNQPTELRQVITTAPKVTTGDPVTFKSYALTGPELVPMKGPQYYQFPQQINIYPIKKLP